MKFSVVMASRLIDYPSSAKNKEQKILRAINSVIMQTFPDWELNIVADGCKKTIELVQKFIRDERVNLFEVEFKKLWAGRPRNAGIKQSKGEWIVYLDIDDIYGERHLETINNGLLTYDWVWYNDIRYRPRLDYWYENDCDIHTLGRHGTSNICHKKSLNILWDEAGKYSHDFYFAQKLVRFKNGGKIATPEYFVCHVPGTGSSGGYDL
jgi:glycosyltransferase involved in cell wall biosynthesis